MGGKIAHEINNPMAIIRGNAEVLEQRLLDGNIDAEQLRTYTSSILNSIDRVTNVVKGLKTLSRSGENDNFQEVLIEDLLDDVMSICRERYKRHGIEVTINMENSDIKVWGLKVQLSQVLINLINNSFDAIRNLAEKQVMIDIKEDVDVEISVTDSGSGIPEEILDKIMEPFYTTKGEKEGTGIGLSISKDIIEAHLGSLRYDHDSPKTRFVITLPKINK